jgi:hypothetical protein
MLTLPEPSATRFFGNFADSFANFVTESLFNSIFSRHAPRGGGKPKTSPHEFIMAQVYHAMAGFGSFSAHCRQLLGFTISDNTLSLRKQSYSRELLQELLPQVLTPLAIEPLHPDAFHGGLRLTAFDGTRFNLRNTPQINASATKTPCNKGSGVPAFAHMLSVVLLELGTHAPLATALGWQGEGELTLANTLFDSVPTRALILADRLYGGPLFIWKLNPTLLETNSHILFRVKSNIRCKRLKRLADGSWIIRVDVQDPATRKKAGTLKLREIHAEIRVEGSRTPTLMRLWTTLLEADGHPATTLVKLYAGRWEHELFFRELKSHIHGAAQLLHAQTTNTAAQEIFALMLAASLLARQRVAVAQEAEVPVLRISLAMVLSQTMALYRVMEHAAGILSGDQQAKIITSMFEELTATALIPERKPRRCQRAVRQPVKNWPKIKHPTSLALVTHIEIIEPAMEAEPKQKKSPSKPW